MEQVSATKDAFSFYGLLFVEDGEKHTNLRNGTDPIATYLRCGALLHRSLIRFGHGFTIVTNKPSLLREKLERESIELAVIEIDFTRDVPETLKFRSAHRKLDLFAAFGRGELGPKPGVLDLDMVMLNQFPPMLKDEVRLVGYDIWNQVAPAYGAERIRRDVARITGREASDLRHWWGGEFLFGPQEAFGALSEAIDEIYERYVESAQDLHHQGDEMVVTAALHSLAHDDTAGAFGVIADGGSMGAVGRWWSARTLSSMEPLGQVTTRSLLHLPADKDILSELQRMPRIVNSALASELAARLRWKTRTRRLMAPLNPILPGPRKFAPKL